jgi:hypothetical protein
MTDLQVLFRRLPETNYVSSRPGHKIDVLVNAITLIVVCNGVISVFVGFPVFCADPELPQIPLR